MIRQTRLMSVAFFFNSAGPHFVRKNPAEPVEIAKLDNLVGSYVIFAKCDVQREGPDVKELMVLSVRFKLVIGDRVDQARAHLFIGPDHPTPVTTVVLNIASPPIPPGTVTVAPGFIPPAALGSGLVEPGAPSKPKGVSVQLLCFGDKDENIITEHVSLTAIKVDAINPT